MIVLNFPCDKLLWGKRLSRQKFGTSWLSRCFFHCVMCHYCSSQLNLELAGYNHTWVLIWLIVKEIMVSGNKCDLLDNTRLLLVQILPWVVMKSSGHSWDSFVCQMKHFSCNQFISRKSISQSLSIKPFVSRCVMYHHFCRWCDLELEMM